MRPAKIVRTIFLKLVLSFTVQFSLAAHAVKDWNLSVEVDPLLQVPSCRAWTDVGSGATEVSLLLSFPQGGQHLPIISVAGFSAGSSPAELNVRLSAKESQKLFLLKPAMTLEEPSIYWYAPIDQVRLTDLIADANTLDIWWLDTEGKEKKTQVSLRGSFATLAEALKCSGQKELQPREFLSLLHEKLESVIAAESATVEETFTQSQKTFAEFVKFKEADQKLGSADQNLLSVSQSLGEAQKALDASQNQLQNLTFEQTQKQNELASLRNSIPLLQEKVRTTENAYAQARSQLADAENRYVPVRDQVAARRQEVSTLKGQVDNIAGRLQRSRDELRNQETNVSFWSARVGQLRQDIDRAQEKLSRLRNQREDAARKLNNYNVQREKERILNQDSNYKELKARLPQLKRKVENLNGRREEIRRALEAARERLRKCQAANKPPKAELTLTGGNAESRKNCNVEKQAVQRIQQEVKAVQADLDQAKRQRDNVAQNIRNKEQNAQDRAEQGRRELAENVRRIDRQIDETKRDISRHQDDIQQLQWSIQTARQRIQSLRSDIFNYERELASARRSLADAQARLERFIRESNYEGLKQRYQEASARVERTRGEARRAREDLQNAESWIAKIEQRLLDLQRLIPAQQQDIAAKTALVTDLERQRDEALAAKTELQVLRDQAFARLDQERKLYQSLILKLQAPESRPPLPENPAAAAL